MRVEGCGYESKVQTILCPRFLFLAVGVGYGALKVLFESRQSP
jgi:hypothetical protein